MRVPVDPPRPSRLRAIVDGIDERPSHPFAALALRGEEVLQVADRFDHGGAAVEEIVHQANELATAFGDERVDGLVTCEEPRPGAARHLDRKRRRPNALVELVVPVPKREPALVITTLDGTDDQ